MGGLHLTSNFNFILSGSGPSFKIPSWFWWFIVTLSNLPILVTLFRYLGYQQEVYLGYTNLKHYHRTSKLQAWYIGMSDIITNATTLINQLNLSLSINSSLKSTKQQLRTLPTSGTSDMVSFSRSCCRNANSFHNITLKLIIEIWKKKQQKISQFLINYKNH